MKRYPNGLDANGNRLWKYRLGYLIGDRKLNSYNLTYDKKFNALWTLSGDFFYNDGYYTNVDDDDKQMNHAARGMRLRADYSYTPQDKLLIGFDLYRQTADLAYDDYKRVSGTKYRLDPLSFNYDKKTEAIYLLNTMNRGKFVFTQGVRREKIAWHFDKVANNGGGDQTSNRWNTGAELSVGYHYSDTGRVYARYERGYTGPDGLQISDRAYVDDVGAYRYVATNAEDEKFDLYEIGVRDKIGISTVSLTLFTSYTGNQMNRFYAMEPDATNHLRLNMRTMNLLRTKRRGIELDLRQRFGKLSLEEGYAYLHGHSEWTAFGREYLDRVGADAIDYTRSGLIKVPKHKGSLRVRYDFDRRFALGLKYTFFGAYNNFLTDAKKQDDGVMASYGLLDLDVHYKANDVLEWYGGVTNIFDKRYYEYASGGMYTLIPGNSRTYFAGMRYSF